MKIHAYQLVMVGFLACFGQIQAETRLALNTSNTEPYVNSLETGFQDLLVKAIFDRMGVPISFHYVQTERALVNVDKGIDDGNLIRIAGLTKLYPNIRQVPEKLFDYDFMIFSNRVMPASVTQEDLKDYRIGFIRGWKIIEKKFENHANTITASNEQGLFSLLRDGKVDMVIHERWRGMYMLKKLEVHDVNVISTPLISGQEMFIYLNKKHQILIPDIANTIKQIKADGTYQDIHSKALKPYINEQMGN